MQAKLSQATLIREASSFVVHRAHAFNIYIPMVYGCVREVCVCVCVCKEKYPKLLEGNHTSACKQRRRIRLCQEWGRLRLSFYCDMLKEGGKKNKKQKLERKEIGASLTLL